MTEQEKIRLRRLLIDLAPMEEALQRISLRIEATPLGLRVEARCASEALASFAQASKAALLAARAVVHDIA